MRLTPVSWGPNGDPDSDHLINDGDNYEAVFRTRSGGEYIHSPRAVASVKTERPGKSPVHAYAQPQSRPLFLWIRLLPGTATVETPGGADVVLTLVDQLQSWFSETVGQQWLVAEDASGQLRRIRAIRTTMEPDTDWTRWNIQLESDYGLWESVQEEGTEYQGVVATEAEPTFTIQARGSMPAHPTITMTPVAVKAAVESPRYRRRIISANRIDRNVDTPNGGYPVDITGGGIDTDALLTAGKLLSNFDDLRVIIDSQERDRWIDTPAVDPSSAVWINWAWRSGKSVALAEPVDADDTILRTNAFNGFGGWERRGALLLGTEAMLYERSLTDIYEVSVTRGALSTTAASHAAAATIRWIQHPYSDLLYGFSNAGEAPAPLNRKPVFDLLQSDNNSWYWPAGPFFNQNDLRTGTFFRMYTNDNPGAPFLRCYESGGKIWIENAYPEAGKPRANNFYIDVPCGLSLTEAAILSTRNAFGRVPKQGIAWFKKVVRTNYAFDVVPGEENLVQYNPVGPGEVANFTWRNYDVIDDGQTTSETREQVENRGVDRVSLGHQQYFVGYDVQVLAASGPVDPGEQTIRAVPQYYRAVKTEVETVYEQELALLLSNLWTTLATKWYITDKESYESFLQGNNFNALPVNRDAFRIRFNVELPVGVDEEGEQLDTIPEEAKASGAYYTWWNIRLRFNQNNTPYFQLGPEEEVYVIDGRLLNETTGEYIDILHPCTPTESLIIDIKNHRILDTETGWEIPHAMRGGTWPTLKEGVLNTWRWIEADANMQLDFSWRTEWN